VYASGVASAARIAFRERAQRRPILFDGAMGTLLFSRGVPQRACLDELVVSHPELISAIHREYLEAGADAIKTAAFGANRFRLAAYGIADQAGRLNRRAAQLAREARDVAGREALVAGSIGPLGMPLRGPIRRPASEVRAAFREAAEGLLEGGADLLLFETHNVLDELLAAIEEARALGDVPIVAEMTFGEELIALDGTTPEAAAEALARADIDAFGVNCGVGPIGVLEALARMGRPEVDGPLHSVMPNAGLPQRAERGFVYAASARYFGESVKGMIAAGATLIGGCCGSTPAYTAAMHVALDAVAMQPAPVAPPVPPTPVVRDSRPVAVETAPPPTGLAERLAEEDFVISVEIDPPRSIRIERTVEAARLLKTAGVDLVNISDSPMARVRMGCLAVAFAVQHDVGLETLVHFTTRDRNVMALQSEILGAHALGIRNVLALTGDPPHVGDYPGASAVWEVDAVGFIGILKRMNRGEDAAGQPIGQPAGFTIACAVDPTADDLAGELDRLAGKLDAGADLVMTQPLYERAQLDRFEEAVARRFAPGGLRVPLLLGILPLHTARHAEFLHNEVPGITIPDGVRAAMHAAGERGAEVGMELAQAFLLDVIDEIQGTYIMPSFGRYEMAAELVRRIRVAQPSGVVSAGSGARRTEAPTPVAGP
jgi:methionine synthase I (cobalamin-dependent)/5,10-methylenetetrahydrofolate reductase